MIQTSDFKNLSLRVSYKAENGQMLTGIVNSRDTKNFFDGEGERAFFEPDYKDQHICPWWIPISKLNVIEKSIRVLAVKPKFASKIIDEKKTIEVRSSNLRLRERVAIYASSPVNKILGTVEIVASSRCNDEIEYELYKNEHLAPFEYYREGKTYFWHLRRPVKFSEPIHYTPKRGAIVWSKTELPEGIQ